MIPLNTALFLLRCRVIDFETMEEVSNKLPRGKSCCADCIPREYWKDETVLLQELYRAAFNAFILGQQPTTHIYKWMAGIVAFVPKILGALEITDNRPIASHCAKLMIFLKILCKNLYKVMEDYKLICDAQEGFRQIRRAKRQLSKINCVLFRATAGQDKFVCVPLLRYQECFQLSELSIYLHRP